MTVYEYRTTEGGLETVDTEQEAAEVSSDYRVRVLDPEEQLTMEQALDLIGKLQTGGLSCPFIAAKLKISLPTIYLWRKRGSGRLKPSQMVTLRRLAEAVL